MRPFPLFLLFLLLAGTFPAVAQNINGEKIQVAADALTVLRFNSEIKRYELGNRDDYTCQVRGNDNSIVIKTIADDPAATNLVVTEGKRTHYFTIVFLKKIDLNNTRLYYDYSDMKVLRRLAEAGGQTVAMAEKAKEAGDKAGETGDKKKSKKQLEKEKRELAEMQAKEAAAIASQEREEALKKQRDEQQKLAAKAEQQRQKEEKLSKAKGEKEAAEARAREKREAEARQKELARLEQQQKDAEKKRLLAEKAEAEKIAKINAIADAKERERQRKLQQDAAAARAAEEAKERKRLKDEKDAKEREAALALKAQQDAEAKRRKDEQAAKAKAEADARIANPYYRNELFRKYPKINFAEPPEGQRLTGEYFLPEDTTTNNIAAMRVLGEKPRLKETSAAAEGITATIQGITFSGVNAYFSIRVQNASKKDYLVGPMQIDWTKGKSGANVKLWAAYVTEYPVLPPGTETVIIFAARGVNASDADKFAFSMRNRLTGSVLEIPFSGKLYNAEMNR